ncbi:50S ribosomal protein L9 [bacterium K02(2017)]|nr:50S ribosomal protein L9 [bacterium K02(2017)]
MQVILQEDYASLGFVGDLVKVKDGFARNYLFPQKIALPANKNNIKLLEHRKKVLNVKKAQKKTVAEEFKAKIDKVKIKVVHAAGSNGKLFGSVTVSDIYEELQKANVELDRKLIKLEAPIKQVGEYKVDVKLHQEVTAQFSVEVEANQDKKAVKAPKKADKKDVKAAAPEASEATTDSSATAESSEKTEKQDDTTQE